MTDNDESAQGKKSPLLGCIFAPALIPILLIFKQYNEIDRGFVVVTLLAVFITILIQRSDIAGEDYFIAVVPALFLSQLVGAMIISLPSWNLSGILLTPLAVGALIFNHYAISLAQKYLSRKQP